MIDGVCEEFHIGTVLIAGMWSPIPRQLPLSPMRVFAIWVELTHDVPVRRAGVGKIRGQFHQKKTRRGLAFAINITRNWR
jgi:hypothetical protein